MYKKIGILTLVMLLGFNLFNKFSLQASAMTMPTNFEAGKKIIKAVGEKLGVNWTDTALSATVGYIAGQYDQGAQPLIPEWWLFGTVPDEIKGDWDAGKYVISPDDFINASKEIKKASDNVKEGTNLYLYGACYQFNKDGGGYVDIAGKYWILTKDSPQHLFVYTNNITWTPESTWFSGYDYGNWWDYNSYINNGVSYFFQVGSGYSSGGSGRNITIASQGYGANGYCNQTISSGQVMNITNVSNTTINNIDNSVTYSSIPSIPLSLNEPNSATQQELDDVFNPPAPVDVEPEDKPTGSSWWEWLLKPLIEAIKGIGDLLASLFIPSEGSFDGLFTDIFDKFNGKLPMINDLGNFFGGVKNTVVDSNAAPPDFKVTMPEAWGGGTFSVIDFKYFTDYRDWVLNFIRFSAWFIFLRRLYNRIPKMIY